MTATRETKIKAKEIAVKYLSNREDDGRHGRAYEVVLRLHIKATAERVHPLGVADMVVKAGVALEAKSGCGWLVNPDFSSKEEAMEYFTSKKKPMKKASHIAYLMQYTGGNIAETRIFTQTTFLAGLESIGLIRAKQGSKKGWGVAIQTFSNSKKKTCQLEAFLMEGETIDAFVARMGKA